jgi:hypothetical protein
MMKRLIFIPLVLIGGVAVAQPVKPPISAVVDLASSGLTGLTPQVGVTNMQGLYNNSWFVYQYLSVQNNTERYVDTLRVQRDVHVDETFGNTYGTIHAYTFNYQTTNRGFEWGIFSAMENYATSDGENVAVIGYARQKVRGASPLWAIGGTAQDDSGEVDPSKPLIAAELDIYANSTDANSKRAALLLVIGTNPAEHPLYAKANASAAIKIGPSNGDAALGQFDTIIQTFGSGVTGVNGVDFSNMTFSGNAWMSTNATIDGSGNSVFAGIRSTGLLEMRNATPTTQWTETDNSNHYFNAVVDSGLWSLRYDNGVPGPIQVDGAKGFVGIGMGFPGAKINVGGDITTTAWTTSGVNIAANAATFTDNSTSGTLAAAYINAFKAPTFAFSNASTITDAYNVYFENPVQGTSATLINKWAMGADSLHVGTSTPFTISTAGVPSANGNAGVTCRGSPTGSFATVNGIVTHC